MKKGWEIKKLSDVCEELFAGGDVPKNNSSKIKSDDFNIPIFSNGEKNKGLYGYTNVVRVKKPSITISARGTIGYSAIREEAFYPAIRLIVATPNTEILDLFFLKYIIGSIDFIHSGSSIPQLTVPMIKEYPIPLPPLPKQRLIVSILDEAFAAIATAKSNAEQNLKNAKELFESYLQEIFDKNDKVWEDKMLSELCEVKDGTHDSPKYIKEGIPFITQKNIRKEGLSFTDTRFITEIDHNKFYKRSNVAFGDILISMIGANRGMACIVDDKRVFSIKNVGLIKSSFKINVQFLLYYLKSSHAMRYVLYMSNGGAQEFVGLTALRSFPIPYPSLKEQQSIVHNLDALSAETKRLEAIYQNKIVALDELKKSILQKAFNGELS